MEEIAEVGEEDGRVVRIEDRHTRLDAVKPGAGGELAFQAVRVALDIERTLAARRLVAKIGDEDRPGLETDVDRVELAEHGGAAAVPRPYLGEMRTGRDMGGYDATHETELTD